MFALKLQCVWHFLSQLLVISVQQFIFNSMKLLPCIVVFMGIMILVLVSLLYRPVQLVLEEVLKYITGVCTSITVKDYKCTGINNYDISPFRFCCYFVHLDLALYVVLIDSLHYARTCSTYLSFQQKLFDAMCIIFNA